MSATPTLTTRNLMIGNLKRRFLGVVVGSLILLMTRSVTAEGPARSLPTPAPLQEGATVVPLWPADKLTAKGDGGPEVFQRSQSNSGRVQSVTNIHNPSIELHLAPPDKRNGTAVIVA